MQQNFKEIFRKHAINMYVFQDLKLFYDSFYAIAIPNWALN